MNLSGLFKQAGRVAAENSPAILSAIGVTGTLATAYFAAKGAFKSANDIREEQEKLDKEEKSHPLSTKEQFELTWKNYIPAAASAALTVASIICSVQIADRRTAAMASAYSVVEKSYAEYRAKNVEKLGKKKEQDLRDELAQDRVNAHPVAQTTLVMTSKGSTLCYDMWTDRYFTSSKNRIDAAVNEFNASIINSSYASLSEFYQLLGIPTTAESDNIGWSTDKLLDVEISGVVDSDGNPALAMDFRTRPMSRFASIY